MSVTMQKSPMVTIFNGRRRSLGKDELNTGIFIQLYKELQPHLKEFSGSQWLVFCAIAFYIDVDGWAWPGLERLAFDTGLNVSTVKVALRGLCSMQVDGCRVLLKFQPRVSEKPIGYVYSGSAGKFLSNHYLLFPTWEECRIFSEKGVKKGTTPWVGFPPTAKPSTAIPPAGNPSTKNNQTKQYPCVDGVLELLSEFGVRRTKKVRALVQGFSVEEVARVIASAADAGVDNPQGLVVSMLDNGDVPPESVPERNKWLDGKYADLYERGDHDVEDG